MHDINYVVEGIVFQRLEDLNLVNQTRIRLKRFVVATFTLKRVMTIKHVKLFAKCLCCFDSVLSYSVLKDIK